MGPVSVPGGDPTLRLMARLRDELDREWQHLVSRPEAAVAFRRWSADDDRLAGFADIQQVLAFVYRPPSPRAGNEVLAALLRLAGDDAFAQRCVLEALMPGLVRFTWRYPTCGDDADDRLQNVLVLAFERIGELAGQEVPWPAATIGGYVRNRLRRVERARRAVTLLPLEAARAIPAASDRTAAEHLAGILIEGVRRGTLRQSDAALLYTTRVAGHSTSSVAATVGVDAVALRTRRLRAEQRLVGQSISVC